MMTKAEWNEQMQKEIQDMANDCLIQCARLGIDLLASDEFHRKSRDIQIKYANLLRYEVA
jgi:hypothetical protein